MTPTHQAPERVAWLQAARQQSQALAELRAAHQAPFVGRLDKVRRTAARPVWLTAALAAGVLGLATVTLATLHRRQGTTPSSKPTVQALGTPAGSVPAVTRRAPAKPRPVVQPDVESDNKPVPRRRPRPARRTGAAKPPVAAKATDATQNPPETTIFEGEEPGMTIIVKPPRKLEPLWTPEQYKKQRAGRQKF